MTSLSTRLKAKNFNFNPMVRSISTWKTTEANLKAGLLLDNGIDGLTAAVEGVAVEEENPKNTTVGYGGAPDRTGIVTLDAFVMNHLGNGGSVILKAESNLNTLIDFRYQQHHKAKRGENGSGQNRTGKSGDDLILKVPLGTQVFEEDNKTLIYDFMKSDEKFVAAAGGKGGLGNTRFKSSTNLSLIHI